MKISALLIVSLFGLSMNLVSAKEISPLMLASVKDQGFSAHISMKQNKIGLYNATLADSLRVLAVDISMDKTAKLKPVLLKTDQPNLGGDSF